MTVYTIETAAAIRRLSESGLSQDQAEAIVETFAESNDTLATKADLQATKAELQSSIAQLRADLTLRIVVAQVATVTLLFAALKAFG